MGRPTIVDVTAMRTYVVADIGQNHNASMATARELIDACAVAGVDCVKGQKRRLDALFSEAELARPYAGPHAYGPTYGEHRAALELTWEQHCDLRDYTNARGMDYTVSVWDPVSFSEMQATGPWPWVKIPSASAQWSRIMVPVLAQREMPIVVSTGMCSEDDVEALISTVDRPGIPWIGALQCTSAYPCPDDAIDLRVMQLWRQRCAFDAVGLSGHHRGIAVDCAAVGMGARIIERHVTLDRAAKGTDHAAALEPSDLSRLVRDIRCVEDALGTTRKRIHSCEAESVRKLRTSRMV